MCHPRALALEHCQPLRGADNLLTAADAGAMLATLPGWSIAASGAIEKDFSFASYAATMLFVNTVAGLAERENHHPALEVRYGGVKVSYRTHDIGGLSRNDFICAAKIEALAGI